MPSPSSYHPPQLFDERPSPPSTRYRLDGCPSPIILRTKWTAACGRFPLLLPRSMGRPTPTPTPQPTPAPVKTWRTFTLKGFSIRNAGAGGSLRSRGLAIGVGLRRRDGEWVGRGQLNWKLCRRRQASATSMEKHKSETAGSRRVWAYSWKARVG